jgi:ligand-binding SRPBCC domain-containing protein
MQTFTFTAEQLLPQPRAEIFPFFADAANLEALTPPWVNFHIVTPQPIEMRVGALIDYRLRIHGLPVRWRTRITAWEPPFRFIDEQLHGPYRLWVHEHTFEPHAQGTLARDHVQYAPLGGALINRLFVRRDIERIFAYRAEALRRQFPG